MPVLKFSVGGNLREGHIYRELFHGFAKFIFTGWTEKVRPFRLSVHISKTPNQFTKRWSPKHCSSGRVSGHHDVVGMSPSRSDWRSGIGDMIPMWIDKIETPREPSLSNCRVDIFPQARGIVERLRCLMQKKCNEIVLYAGPEESA